MDMFSLYRSPLDRSPFPGFHWYKPFPGVEGSTSPDLFYPFFGRGWLGPGWGYIWALEFSDNGERGFVEVFKNLGVKAVKNVRIYSSGSFV
jgi:hypothetical protein